MAVTFDVSGLDRLAASFLRAETRVVTETQALVVSSAEDVARIAQAHVLVDTGALRHAIGFDLDPDGMGATIGPWTGAPVSAFGPVEDTGRRVDYGPYVEYGTRPHSIDPVNASVLAFQGPDGPVFARHVDHPGTKAHPFMEPAGEHVRPLFAAGVLAIGRRVV